MVVLKFVVENGIGDNYNSDVGVLLSELLVSLVDEHGGCSGIAFADVVTVISELSSLSELVFYWFFEKSKKLVDFCFPEKTSKKSVTGFWNSYGIKISCNRFL